MNKSSTRIHKPDPFYTLLKIYEIFSFRMFYRRVEVTGRENIPYDNPIIFAANHQNPLIDPLAVLNSAGMNVVFMARADIFKKKAQARALTFLKILPVYRMRDGAEELSRNSETFEIALKILEDKMSICLMPEGNHGNQRRLRSLAKGTFRIAFSAQEKFGDSLDVKLVPVGLEYSHYQKIRHDVLINYGKPIAIKDYMDSYRENQPKALNILKDKLAEELKKVMIHIENIEFYDMCQDLRHIYNDRMRNRLGLLKKDLYARFQADKVMIRILDENIILKPELIKLLSEKVYDYMNSLKSLNLRNWVIDRKGFSSLRIFLMSLLLIAGLPVFLFGWLNNIIPYIVPQHLAKNVKDLQFHASIKLVVAMFFFLVYYIVTATVVGIVSGHFWIALGYIITGLLTGNFALHYAVWFKKLRAAIKYRILQKRSDPEFIKTVSLHSSIISVMNILTEKYQDRYKPENIKVPDVG